MKKCKKMKNKEESMKIMLIDNINKDIIKNNINDKKISNIIINHNSIL